MIGKIKSPFLKIAGYLILLVQSVPVWTGLMTLPFAAYLIVILSNIPVNLPKAFSDFIINNIFMLNTFVPDITRRYLRAEMR